MTSSVPKEREELFGILCYANSASGFSGILKQRYTDFKVSEIDLRGRVLQLESLDWEKEGIEQSHNPDGQSQDRSQTQQKASQRNFDQSLEYFAEKAQPVLTEENPGKQGSSCAAATTSPACEGEETTANESKEGTSKWAELDQKLEQFAALAGDANAEKLRGFMQEVKAVNEDTKRSDWPEPIFLEAEADKEARKAVHEFFKSPLVFADLATETIIASQTKSGAKRSHADVGGSSIRIAYHPPKKRNTQRGRSGGHQPARQRKPWPGGHCEYLHCLLYKHNMDTQEALGKLKSWLRVRQTSFGTAGNKDKRGATVQGLTIHKVHPERLVEANSRLSGIQVGNFSFVQQPLHLGSLCGNQFEIIVRDVKGDPRSIAAAVDALKTSGFINYFGLQRFGSEASPTNQVGCHLLKGEWEEAANLIMKPRDWERSEVTQARKLYFEGNIRSCIKTMPYYLGAEHAIVTGLGNYGHKNYLDALLSIPRNMRLMYLHAVQSYLWNLAASSRITKLGTESVCEGDLVLPPTAPPRLDLSDVENEPASAARLTDVHVVSAEDIEAGRYSIEDVVLPLPGRETVYPQNQIAQVYEEEATKLGISLKAATHKVKEFAISSLPGDYRRILHKPKDLTWELLEYDSANEDLAVTQLEALRQRKQFAQEKPEGAAAGRPRPLGKGEALADGRLLALKLNFQLPPSNYATMLLRELMKETTATVEHRERTLTNQEGNKPVEQC